MSGLDTNVLVRLITQDDPEQGPVAAQALRSFTPSRPGFVSTVVLCELSWVLRHTYRFPRKSVLHALRVLADADNLRLEAPEHAERAIRDALTGGAGFADRMVAQTHAAVGVAETLTFDRAAAKLDGWRRLR